MIAIPSFTGAYPSVPAHLLPDNAAQQAANCDVRQGELSGVCAAASVLPGLPAGTKGIFTPDGFRFLASPTPLRAALSPVVDDRYGRLYFTTKDGFRVCRKDDLTAAGGAVTTYLPGVPAPDVAITVKKVRKRRWPNYPNTVLKAKFYLESSGQRYKEVAVTPTLLPGAEPFSSYTFDSTVNVVEATQETAVETIVPGNYTDIVSIWNAATSTWVVPNTYEPIAITPTHIAWAEYTNTVDGGVTTYTELASTVATKVMRNGKELVIDYGGTGGATSTSTPKDASAAVEVWLENTDNAGERVWTAHAGINTSGAISTFPGNASVSLTPTGTTTYRIDFTYGIVESRAYVYTFVNDWQEESQPSFPATVDVTYLDDVELMVSTATIGDLFAGRVGFDCLRFYCAVQGGGYLGVNAAPVQASNALTVTDLYHTILWREPDTTGLAYWEAQYAAGLSLADIASNFYASHEYKDAKGYLFIEDLYLKLLGRTPDDAGFEYWQQLYESGYAFISIIWLFLESAEYKSTAAYTAANTGTPNASYVKAANADPSLAWFYSTFLARAPDASGDAYWPPRISANRYELAAMISAMMQSAEYMTLNLTRYITALLTVAYGRTPTSGEITTAVNKYNSGYSFNALAYATSTVTSDGYVDEGTRTGTALMSLDWAAPKPDMTMLTELPNGVFSCVRGRELYFSEPYLPYAWPTNYVQTVKHDVVGTMAYNGQLLVTTQASPIIVSGAHPGGMTQQAIGAAEAGVSEFGMAVVNGLPVYASKDGLVTINGLMGSLDMSHRFWTSEKWRETYGSRLSSIQMLAHDGRLLGLFSSGDGFILDYSASPPHLVDYSQVCVSSFRVPGEEDLYITTSAGRYKLLYGTRGSFSWRSKEFTLLYPRAFTVGELVANGNFTVTIYGDTTPLHSVTLNSSGVNRHTFRLPSGVRYERFSVKVAGTGIVQQLVFAESGTELSNG